MASSTPNEDKPEYATWIITIESLGEYDRAFKAAGLTPEDIANYLARSKREREESDVRRAKDAKEHERVMKFMREKYKPLKDEYNEN